jgi:hypothetical protein
MKEKPQNCWISNYPALQLGIELFVRIRKQVL